LLVLARIGEVLLLSTLTATRQAVVDDPPRLGRRDRLESAGAGDQAFERQLWRERAHLLEARRRAGLVVDDGNAAVGQRIEPVGAHPQQKIRRDLQDAIAFDAPFRDIGPLGLRADEPAGDLFEARPPERDDLGEISMSSNAARPMARSRSSAAVSKGPRGRSATNSSRMLWMSVPRSAPRAASLMARTA
jgi:hypothetical protein